MKLTLLELTQNILSALNSDQVNSISDTVESLQVAEVIKTTYMNMLGRYELPEHNQLIQLQPSNDESAPVLMYVPSGTVRLEWIKYFDTNPADGNNLQEDQFGAYSTHDVNTDLQDNANGWSTNSTSTNTISLGSKTFSVTAGQTISPGDVATASVSPTISMSGTVTSYSGTTLVLNITTLSGSGTYSNWTIDQQGAASAGPGYKPVEIMTVEDFMTMVHSFNPTDDDVEAYDLTILNNTTGQPANFTIFYKNDITPRHCCIISNYYILFDSYDNTQDSTLQASKTMSMAWVQPEWKMVDTFVPPLDDSQFPLLINSAKELAFFEIKNQPHQIADREVDRQVVSLQKWKAIADKPTYYEALPDFGRRSRGGWSFKRRFDGGWS